MFRLFFGTLILSLSVFFCEVRDVFAADIIFVPSSGTITSDLFTVDVYVSGNTEPINGVSVTVSFSTTQLSVASISKTGSIISLWAEEPSYSNSAGTIRFEGVILNPGFSGAHGKVGSIRFTKKPGSLGQSSLQISSGSVLANDGKATNVTRTLGSGSFTLAQAAVVPTPASSPAVSPVLGVMPVITSTTHPLEESWYADNVPSFTWSIPSGVSSVRLGYSASENTIPGKVYTPALAEKTLEVLEDGQYWFAAQFKSGTVWGPVARYKVQIDTTAPAAFAIIQTGTSIDFSTTDETSGIDHYEVIVDDLPAVQVASDADTSYDLALAGSGQHRVMVKAVDRAGNVTSAPDIVVTLPSITEDIVVTPSLFDKVSNGMAYKTMLYGSLALLLGLALSILWFAVIRFALLRKKIRRDLVSIEQTIKDDFLTLREHLDLSSNHVSARSKAKPVMDKMLKNSKETIDLVERDITHKMENVRKRL